MTKFLQEKEHKFYESATRLQIENRFKAHDFYDADVFYRDSCYIKFVIKKKVTFSKDEKWKIYKMIY